MHWTAWILLSAVFLALYDLAKKASVRDNAVIPVLLCSTTFGCLAFLVGLFVCGRLAAAIQLIDSRVLALGLAKAALVGTSWIFTFCALRTLPITIATPIRASAPALVFVIAFFLYGEVPGVVQAIGMLTVFAGYWAFSWAGKAEGIDFFHNRAVWCAIVGAVFSACSSIFDKYVFGVAKSPIEPTQLVFQAGLIVVYAVSLAFLGVLGRVLGGTAASGRHVFSWRWTIPCVGVLLAFADYLLFNAMAMPETPVSVASLLRRFSVVITFVLGAVCFRETNLRRKAVALGLILVGIVLLVGIS